MKFHFLCVVVLAGAFILIPRSQSRSQSDNLRKDRPISGNLREQTPSHQQDQAGDDGSAHELVKTIDSLKSGYQLLKKENESISEALLAEKKKISRAWNQTLIVGSILLLAACAMLAIVIRTIRNKKHLVIRQEQERNQLKIAHQLEFARLRSDFFANLSHEFRTPLTLILTPLAQMIRNETSDSLRQSYEMIQRNANQMLFTVNQFLELSKIETGHDGLKAGKNNILAFMREIIATFKPLSDGARINIILLHETHDLWLYFDKQKLEKVFYNLLSNAFRRTPSGGSITIHLKKCLPAIRNFDFEFPEGGLEISVRDTGKGIPAAHLPYIFNRFYQISDKEKDDNAIGLALAKEIAELHCGSLTVTSGEGYGAEFIVTLPLGKGHLETDELENNLDDESGTDSVTTAQSGVLIATSLANMRRFMENTFSGNYNLITADNGAQCITIAQRQNPELIVIDSTAPDLDGNILAAMLRKMPETSHIPIVLLMSKYDQRHKIEGIALPADDFLIAPCSGADLISRCRHVLDQRQRRRELFQKGAFTDLSEITVTSADNKFLRAATDVVTEHLQDTELSALAFCREMDVSHAKLQKKITALTGLQLPEFVRRLRLWKAAEIISHDTAGTCNMNNISCMVGFSNRQFFIRSFRQHYSMTPAEYRAWTFKKQESHGMVREL